MTAPLKVIIMLVVWLLYSIIFYNYKLIDCCSSHDETTSEVSGTTEEGPAVVDPGPTKSLPLAFKWTDATAYTGDGFDALKQSILDGQTDDNKLVITGFYHEGEAAPEGYDNMGFARADQIRNLFLGDIPEDRIELRARLVDEKDGVRTNLFEAASFDWKEIEGETTTVEDIGDRILIRFPFNSTTKDYDPAVDEYLDKLAARMIQTGERVSLTGHTDNVGDDDANRNLGRNRARQIRSILTEKGVPASQITIDSKGETQPVASNDTDAGRHENRRVEVRLIKQ